VRTLARARTLTVLGRLDEAHKRSVAQFLVEAFLIQDKSCTVLPCKPVISLEGADLEGVYFGGTAATNTNGAYSASFVPWTIST